MPKLPNMVCINLITDEAVPALLSVMLSSQFIECERVNEFANV